MGSVNVKVLAALIQPAAFLTLIVPVKIPPSLCSGMEILKVPLVPVKLVYGTSTSPIAFPLVSQVSVYWLPVLPLKLTVAPEYSVA